MSATKIRVLIVDDHVTFCDLLALYINQQPDMEVVGEAHDGAAAVVLAGTRLPSVALVDLSMPGMSGLETIAALKRTTSDTRVVVLTRRNEYRSIESCLRAGASGYVLKHSPSREVLEAIRAVSRGRMYLDPLVAEQVVHRALQADRPSPLAPDELSERETEVLRLLARGFTNRDAAAELGLSVKTIESHRANAMAKAGLRTRVDLIRFAVTHGWLQDA